MFESLFNLIKFFTGQSPKFKHIHRSSWSCIIGDLDIAQIIGLGEILTSIDSSYKIESLLTAIAKKVDFIFKKLSIYENIIDWVQFYQKPYIIASLNPNISKISNNDWYAAPNSTNCAEAFKNKKSQKPTEHSSDKNNLFLDMKGNEETLMIPMEKLEYKEYILLIEKRKEKLRELQIINTIKERELEQE
ncbi:31609_t:CDS:2 [Racocetra persica]|uniref:31609_t:CDS:1 n=1 Tax=Racocetra persica TaxID=160502 RepID=A0ACA9KI38_9GLOM|nr:31609_t:CDS:2 [Racocetra persica]